MARARRGPARASRLACDGIELDEEHQSAIIGGTRTEPLTAQEFRLLRCFMHHAGQVLSKTFLAEHVYGLDADPGSNVIELRTPRALVPVPCDMPVVCAAADWLPS